MSRLIVKNLPKHYTLERFKEHFGQKGEVTDAKLVKNGDGVFRRFGYIGYKTEKDAKAALKYFNNTFIDTSKIQVEAAKAIGDTSLPRPWSRYSQGSSAFQRKNDAEEEARRKRAERQERIQKQREETENDAKRKQTLISKLYADEQDPKLKEFLEVMRPRSLARGKTWANDDILPEDANTIKKSKVKAKVLTVPNKKTGGDGLLVTKSHVTFDDSDDELYDDLPAAGTDQEEAVNDNGQNSVAHDNTLSDMDYLRMKMNRNIDDENEADDSQIDMEHDDDVVDSQQPSPQSPSHEADATQPASGIHASRLALMEDPTSEPAPSFAKPLAPLENDMPPADIIADTGRLFVKNLPFSCTEEDLHKLFEKYGPLSEVHIPIEKATKKSKGFAFILFLLPEHAVKAFVELDGSIFQGRLLEILPGKEKPRPVEEDADPASFKAKRDKQRKAGAGNEFTWNSLFMNSDTVAEAMAKKLGVKKGDILNPEAEDMAVRLALAETHIITETKKYLEDEGIDLSAFEKRKERSKTIILVKNLPANTEEEELQEVFAKFGDIGRMILVPAKTIALVEFLRLNEAKSAFQRLAFSKFKHLPLYLEWAPIGTFKKEFDREEHEARRKRAVEGNTEEQVNGEPVSPSRQTEDDTKAAIQDLATPADGAEDPDAMPVATLFVKNLNFNTTEEGLMQAFGGCRGLRTARVATKPDKKTGGKLSMGFGFLEFNNKEDAMRCMKSLQSMQLDGHTLQLKFSNAAAKSTTQVSKKRGSDGAIKATGSKLIVRNIPFEATKRDIRQLFSSFGQIKSLRLPKKPDNTHRGFCFIDFLTKQEAKSAFESLASTHLYGRHLVLEWAEDENSVEAMREKTAKAFFKDGGASKKRRIEMDDNDGGEDDGMEE
ncbi:hypothetical protein BC832DRAFT_564521 [Gaertneriomyces semiglobifer]|nr:hypothetical protein BC832DRAFT_564521 [Gaertneriomyces semiglobifer]